MSLGSLLIIVEDTDKDVRERVTEALGKMGGPAVVKPLIQNLKDVRKK
jgi:HEAT repeat protein